MTFFREKFANFVLLLLGIAWGNLLLTELLSLPEWWFAGVAALLTASGIFISVYLPDEWKLSAPSIMMLPVMMMEPSDWRSAALMLIFGIWYGAFSELRCNWRVSRNFCGGFVIGGVLTGMALALPYAVVFLPVGMIFHAGLKKSYIHAAEMLILAIFVCLLYSFPKEKTAENIDTGTVISAFSLVKQTDSPAMTLIGTQNFNQQEIHRELSMASKIFFTKLPGSIPQKCDMIIAADVTDIGDGGVNAMMRFLKKEGVLVLPVRESAAAPDFSWFRLPGSNGRFAACSPGRNLSMIPEKMDDNLAGHFRHAPDGFAPSRGALAGMLIDFKSEKLTPSARNMNKMFWHIIAASAFIISVTAVFPERKKSRECGRIIFNCAGYTMMISLLIPIIFSGLSTFTSLRGLAVAAGIMWFFRRPVKKVQMKQSSRFSGFLAIAALILTAFFPDSWSFAVAALVFGGYAFTGLDDDLCGELRSENIEIIRFTGIAIGTFAAYWMQKNNIPLTANFIIVVILRFWSWFRN